MDAAPDFDIGVCVLPPALPVWLSHWVVFRIGAEITVAYMSGGTEAEMARLSTSRRAPVNLCKFKPVLSIRVKHLGHSGSFDLRDLLLCVPLALRCPTRFCKGLPFRWDA